jgi:transcriptional regulator with XRE-family HTH domain
MTHVKHPLLPRLVKILKGLGENVKLARLRRKLSAQLVSERAGISRSTLWQIEKGNPTVALGAYIQVLFALGLENDFIEIAKDDILGKKLQDLELLTPKRAPKAKA